MRLRSCDLAPGGDDNMDSDKSGELEFRFKDSESISGNCAAGYGLTRNGRPGWAIQGKYLTAAEEAQLRDRAGDEGGIWIPENVARQIARYYREQG